MLDVAGQKSQLLFKSPLNVRRSVFQGRYGAIGEDNLHRLDRLALGRLPISDLFAEKHNGFFRRLKRSVIRTLAGLSQAGVDHPPPRRRVFVIRRRQLRKDRDHPARDPESSLSPLLIRARRLTA